MRVIEITEDKVSKLSENIEKGLRYLGKAMQCIEEMEGGQEYGERYGERYGESEYRIPERGGQEFSRYGSRYGYRMGR